MKLDFRQAATSALTAAVVTLPLAVILHTGAQSGAIIALGVGASRLLDAGR